MNASISLMLNSGLDLQVAYLGEMVTIPQLGVTVSCLRLSQDTFRRKAADGGIYEEFGLQLGVRMSDLPTAPAVNTSVTFNGRQYRIDQISASIEYWTLSLQPGTAAR